MTNNDKRALWASMLSTYLFNLGSEKRPYSEYTFAHFLYEQCYAINVAFECLRTFDKSISEPFISDMKWYYKLVTGITNTGHA